ncbi:MAG: hypothetical protein RLP02_35725, partial [Coleofasciculus sp. C2-GNP5-27]
SELNEKQNPPSPPKNEKKTAPFLCKNAASVLQKQWVCSRHEVIGWVQNLVSKYLDINFVCCTKKCEEASNPYCCLLLVA